MFYQRIAFIVLAGALFGAGCEHAQVKESVTTKFGGSGEDAQMEFWHRLNDAPVASNDDAFHAILLYLDGKDDCASYADRVAGLKKRGLVSAEFDAPANQSVERGTVAVALVRALEIKGGLMLRVLGPTPRYATRELYFEGIYPPSTPNQAFSGAELVGIIGKVEDFQRGDAANKRAAELPGENAEK